MKFDSELPTTQMALSQNEELKSIFGNTKSFSDEKEIIKMSTCDISTINITVFYEHISNVIKFQHEKKQRRNKNNKILAVFLFQYLAMKNEDPRKWTNHIHGLLKLYPVMNKTTLTETIKIGKYIHTLKQIIDLQKLYDMTYDEIREKYAEHISKSKLISSDSGNKEATIILSDDDSDSKIMQKLAYTVNNILNHMSCLKTLKIFNEDMKNLKNHQNILFANGMKELIINTIKEHILYLDENMKIKNKN